MPKILNNDENLENNEENTETENTEKDSFDDYFTNLLEQEKNNIETKTTNENVTKNQYIQTTEVKSVLKDFGLNSFEELEELRQEDPEQYYDIHSKITLSLVASKQNEHLEKFKENLKIETILNKAKDEQINEKELTAFCKYYSMPINQKSFELYKKTTTKKNNKFVEINNLSNIQQQTPKNISGDIAENNDYYAKAKELMKRI